MILTFTLNKKRSSEMHFKQIIRRFKLIPSFFLFCTCGIYFGVEKNVANNFFINRTLWKNSFDILFTLILRYFRFFRHSAFPRSGRKCWMLDFGDWTLVDWFRTESELSFWFWLHYAKFFEWKSLRYHDHAYSVEGKGSGIVIFRTSILIISLML